MVAGPTIQILISPNSQVESLILSLGSPQVAYAPTLNRCTALM